MIALRKFDWFSLSQVLNMLLFTVFGRSPYTEIFSTTAVHVDKKARRSIVIRREIRTLDVDLRLENLIIAGRLLRVYE